MTVSIEGQRLNVLLIDDTVAERDLYELVLRAEFEVLTASRGDIPKNSGSNPAMSSRNAPHFETDRPGTPGSGS